MTSPLTVLLPFFALVVIGFFSARKGLIEPAGVKGLNAFIFYFALPALLFDKTQGAPVDKLIDERAYMLAYAAIGLLVFAVTWAGARALFRITAAEGAIVGLGGVYGNIGFMGIPVLTAALGDWVAVPLALIVLVDVALLVPVATTIMDMNQREGPRRKLLPAIAASVFKNPVVLATLAGLAVAFAPLEMPVPVLTFTDLLGGAAGPAAMFTLGAVLAGRPLSQGWREAAFATTIKVAVYPACVWAAMTLFAIGEDWRLAATLGAAMPMATVMFVLAQQFNVMAQRTSTAVLISTVAAMATVTALTAFLANG